MLFSSLIKVVGLASSSNRKVRLLVRVGVWYLAAGECFPGHHSFQIVGFAVPVFFFDTHLGEAIILC